jgi:hypothetical protein
MGATGSEAVNQLSRVLLRQTNHTGSDVRIVSGEIMNEKVFGRQPISAQWWHWNEVFSKRWKVRNHINCLELEALVLGIKSRFSDMARAIRAFSKFQVLMSASAL